VSKTPVRCAIYTRKSSDEGLEQVFNSLDAQREACAAYVASQKGQGWRLLPQRYDDGGVSGGTLERPGLQRLLSDIEAGKVDLVVVYKVDRLTRSLADFAKLVERFDGAGVSFVSVTQHFNTATSMGRLTLNVLLSFAQFEREVTAERIRDKITASKKKGLWMGGRVPLGYDVEDRTLVVNEAEAPDGPDDLPALSGARMRTARQGSSGPPGPGYEVSPVRQRQNLRRRRLQPWPNLPSPGQPGLCR
jgi:site-specific DNA recombinase